MHTLTISDLLFNHSEPINCGTVVTCRVCGRHTVGMERDSKTFLSAYQLRNGDGFCVSCLAALEHKPFRNRSWIVTRSAITWINAETDGMERVRKLIDQCDEPTGVQLTFSGQKHTWLAWPFAVTTPGMNGVWIYTDLCDKPVFLDRPQVKTMASRIEQMLVLPKSEVQEATFGAKSYQKMSPNFLDEIQERYHGRLDWKLAVAIYWRRDRASRDHCKSRQLEEAPAPQPC